MNHKCHWLGCNQQVPPKMWGCKVHWFTLLKRLRNKLWATYRPGQEVDKQPSAEYIAVANEVYLWVLKYKQEISHE